MNRLTAYLIPAILIAIGALILADAFRFPEYTDPNWQSRFPTIGFPASQTNALVNKWYATKASVQTPRDALQDFGAGIIALGVSIALIFKMRSVWNLADIARMTSPASPIRFYLLATLVWLSFIPAEWFFYNYRDMRGDDLWFAESVPRRTPHRHTHRFLITLHTPRRLDRHRRNPTPSTALVASYPRPAHLHRRPDMPRAHPRPVHHCRRRRNRPLDRAPQRLHNLSTPQWPHRRQRPLALSLEFLAFPPTPRPLPTLRL